MSEMTDLIVGGFLNPKLTREWSINDSIATIRDQFHDIPEVNISLRPWGGQIDIKWMGSNRSAMWFHSYTSGHRTAQEAAETLKRSLVL